MKTSERVAGRVETMLSGEDLELVAVDYVKEGSERVLRVFIENREGEVDLEDCERISRGLSDWLDEEDFISESYILEVSSPGLERPLRGREDFSRFAGENVFIRTYAPIEDKKEFTGILQGIDDDTVEVMLKENGKRVALPYSSIAKARLDVDFQLE
ncbi:ribosome maturation factor RimP [Halarsenatibacter silvermanii]|uniref:Ribosome maturation factor RimP n=1 Tax=Halarsenatibacter silvermanii TaxID=321763 RepID=A0A1G9LH73_9FIRM|nr:ribosome maturation factor RimP [Halarsenatibacter silvermanii]SDL61254.1 ribosome maturation factor RimP [Halarsenatibacter silvermanii]